MDASLLIIFWIICGVAAGAIAGAKGRSAIVWFVLGIALGPLMVLAVGFMPSVSKQNSSTIPISSSANEKVLFSEQNVRITTQRAIFGAKDYPLISLQPVKVTARIISSQKKSYSIHLSNLNGIVIGSYYSDNADYAERVKEAINKGIAQLNSKQSADLLPNSQSVNSSTLLEELKSMLDKGLITQQEYQAKKQDILSRM
jgi:hypothetical protein